MAECVCGRPVETRRGWPLSHSDGGDPWYCYPEESGMSIESRCTVELDEYVEEDVDD